MNNNQQHDLILKLLKWAVFAVFIGRAWQYVFWDAPYRTLLWDQSLMDPLLAILGVKWTDWASSASVDNFIQTLIVVTGFIYVLAAIGTLFLSKKRKYFQLFIWLGLGFMVLLFLLEMKEKFYDLGQFFEHSSQLFGPIALIGLTVGWMSLTSFQKFAKWAIGLTFFCHGLYATGYYPRPGAYVDMYVVNFNITEDLAHQLIFIAGVIDLVLPFFFILSKWDKYALVYAAVWGLLTAFIRIVTGFYIDYPWESLHQVWFLTSYRLIHGLLPVCVLISIAMRRDKSMGYVNS